MLFDPNTFEYNFILAYSEIEEDNKDKDKDKDPSFSDRMLSSITNSHIGVGIHSIGAKVSQSEFLLYIIFYPPVCREHDICSTTIFSHETVVSNLNF